MENLRTYPDLMSRMMRWGLALGMLLAVGAMSAPVRAQQGVIDLEETVIQGRIQKPEAFYILQPANLDYEPFHDKPSFLPELLDSVNEDEF